jgi:hypothetical protein
MTVLSEFGMLPYYISEAISYVGWAGAGYLGWRVVRAYERRSVARARLRSLRKRIHRLEAWAT